MWRINPLHAVDRSFFATVDLWMMCRAQDGRHLPGPGGIGDQCAPLWDCFNILPRLWDEAEEAGKS